MFNTQTDEQIERDINEIVDGLNSSNDSSTNSTTTEVQIKPPPSSPSEFQLGGVVIYLLLAVMVAGLLALIYQVVRNFRSTASKRGARSRPRGRRRRKSADARDGAKQPPPRAAAPPRDPSIPLEVAEWLELASEAYLKGDYRESVRCRYRAVVSLLAHRRIVVEDETTTAGEYVLSVDASNPGQTRNFATAALIFETAWYSDRPIEEQSALEMEELFDELQVGTR
jgi:Domain of unknown function (DUF4129)